MAKRRKKSAKGLPAKGRMREMCDRCWSKAVKSDGAYRCAMCGARGKLDAHHLISRSHYATRYLLENGLCLCSTCHQWCPDRSPHQSAAGFMLWLKESLPHRHRWLVEMTETGDYRSFTQTKNADFYCEQLQRLRQYVEPEEFETICGINFTRYLTEDHAQT